MGIEINKMLEKTIKWQDSNFEIQNIDKERNLFG